MDNTKKEKRVSLFKRISDAIGKDKVKNDEPTLVTYGFDASIAPFQKPSLVVLPENRDDVREVLMLAITYSHLDEREQANKLLAVEFGNQYKTAFLEYARNVVTSLGLNFPLLR